MNKKGVLLINLGTPDNADPLSVYRYLTQFLNDPRVIDLSFLLRWILANLFIIPFRYKNSTEAYRKIWTSYGSPLLVNSKNLQRALSFELGNSFQVEIGMRYGKPSIKSALHKMKNCEEITVIPLFPQYASATTGSAISNLFTQLTKNWNIPAIAIKREFYNNSGYIAAYAELIKENIAHKNIEQLIFSYHGLPDRHINKSECVANCKRMGSCPNIDDSNRYCYRAQCYKTSDLLAKALKLEPHQYTVAFQSRLGKTQWIQPQTDEVLTELRQKGIKSIAIVCPSFVVDCLETLEEINIREREKWINRGGNEFIFIPCINDSLTWVKALAEIARS